MASTRTGIEWTDCTWNVLRGCSRVSEGCRHCYAERVASRFWRKGAAYEGLARPTINGPRWTGEVRFVEEALELPLRWRKPRRIFVNSMSDLFHEKVEERWLDLIFGVMLQARQHTYQILTKRADRMRDYLTARLANANSLTPTHAYPRHIWLGVSVEDQATADERIPLLLQTPAALRWVSYEPALGPVDFARWLTITRQRQDMLDWIVVGGESGPGARPFDLAWARSTIAQCKAAGVPVFMKQMGRWVLGDHTGFRVNHWLMKDGRGFVPPIIGRFAHERPEWAVGFSTWNLKGGDPDDWPEALRVREYPCERRPIS